MKEVKLKMKEQKKYDVIKELIEHNGNKSRAALKLGIPKRQIIRLSINSKEKDIDSILIHGLSGKPSNNSAPRQGKRIY